MVLNALEVDPGRVWKGPWRWYHEEMLECCTDLETIRQEGITFQQFSCLATCNRLNVQPTIADEEGEEQVQAFREAILASVQSEDCVLVVSYDRQVLGQTGSGHFSPLGAYDHISDRVLVLDVARFKYPPHWVEVALLYRAMTKIDPTTGQARGYAVMQISEETTPLLMFELSKEFVDRKPETWQAVLKWLAWLKEPQVGEISVRSVAERVARTFCNFNVCCEKEKNCCKSWSCKSPDIQDLKSKLKYCCSLLCTELKNTEFHTFLTELQPTVASPRTLTALFLSWPFSAVSGQRSKDLNGYADETRNRFSRETQTELNQLRVQLQTLLNEFNAIGPEG